MKRNIIRLMSFLFAILVLQSCEKETEGFTDITTYAVFDMQGEPYESIVVGEEFNDAGAIAMEGETPLDVTVSGVVDNSSPGMYEITYSAVNADGFASSVTRYVAVLPEEVTGESLAGSYTMNGEESTIRELAPGFYRLSNVWPPNSIPVYILSADGINGELPEIASPYGPVYGSMTSKGNTFEFIINLPSQGISDRSMVWVKN